MSTNSTAHVPRAPARSSCSSCRVNCRRLTSPVSGSCWAVCVSSSSACLRSVTSAKTPSKQACAVLVDDPARLVAHPHDVPVGVQEAVLVVEQARLLGVALVAHHARAIVGMDALHPQLRIGHPLLRAVAEHRLDLRAHVEAASGGTRLPAVRGDRHALEQRTKALFAEMLGGGVIHEDRGAHPAGAPACPIGSGAPDGLGRRPILPGCGGCAPSSAPAALLAVCAAPARARGHARRPADAQIAARFAPRLVLHPEERYAPTSADELLALGVGAAALRDVDVLVVLDISDVKRLGVLGRRRARDDVPKLVIDHHIADRRAGRRRRRRRHDGVRDRGARVRLRRASSGSRSRRRWRRALYAALLTDTGGFRFSNTTPRCHAIAGQLLAAGIEPEEMYRRVYASVPARQARPPARRARHARRGRRR